MNNQYSSSIWLKGWLLLLLNVGSMLLYAQPEPLKSAPDSLASKSEVPKTEKQTTPLVAYKNYNPAEDVMLFPPKPPCSLLVDTRNEFSGAKVRQSAFAELFQYSNPALKAFLAGKTQIVCEASLSLNGNANALILKFSILDPNARKSFGKIDRDALALLQFTDGSLLNLQSSKSADGDLDPQSQQMNYLVTYPLDNAAFRKIKKHELDRIRIAWTAGYEDYEIQQVDALMNLGECLEQR